MTTQLLIWSPHKISRAPICEMTEYNDSPFIKYCRRRPSSPGGENEWGEDAEKEGLAEEETPIHVTTEAGPATGNQEELEEKALGNVSTLYHAPCTIHFVP